MDDDVRRINDAGLKLIRRFEGCRLRAYQDAIGVWTIGYGHTKDVLPDAVITQERAETLLAEDVQIFEQGISRLVKVPITDNQFSALVSLAFNIGLGNVGRSTLLKRLNSKKYTEAADQFLLWVRAGGQVLPGLKTRRAAERALFLRSEK